MSATNDYVEEVALGDFTHMNTVEFKFYGFYHRIRQKLEQFWGKSIQEKAEAMFRAGRRMPASQNLITSLQVKLNAKGEIVGVKILGASGVKELDDAAIESFNQAGPFPNPPKDLLINDVATIEWGFVVNS
jgi:protein TonB